LQASLDRARGHVPGNAKGASELERRTTSAKGRAKGKAKGKAKATGSDRAAAPGLRDLSKGELYDLAAELDVSGRSSMTKPQLEEAVAAARKGRGQRGGRSRRAS
jgi:DNA end-binding protein Ku